MIAAGGVLLALFVQWQHHRERVGREPLVRLAHLKIPPLRSGLSMFLAQNLIMMGVFFIVPLYLQIVQGFDAFETGLRMLPVSVTLFLTATLAPRLAARVSPRLVVRLGLVVLLVACGFLLTVIDPDIDTGPFLAAMAVLGVGMGLLASQLGNVVQSSVDESARSEAGGLQFTAQQLGAALGTALMGAIVIGGLATAVGTTITSDARISDATQQQVSVQLEAGVPFIPADDVRAAADDAGLPPGETDAIVEAYEESQLDALKAGLLFAAFVVLVSFLGTRSLPGAPLQAPEPISDAADQTG